LFKGKQSIHSGKKQVLRNLKSEIPLIC